MTTIENTVAMMEVLPEADLVKIQDFTRKLFLTQSTASPFCPKSKEEIYQDLEISRKQASEGKCRSAEEVFNELERKYGL